MILSSYVHVLQTVVNTRRTLAEYRNVTDVIGSSTQKLVIEAGDTVTFTQTGSFFAMQSNTAIQVTFGNGLSSETLTACKFCVIETTYESWSLYNNTTDTAVVDVFVGFNQ